MYFREMTTAQKIAFILETQLANKSALLSDIMKNDTLIIANAKIDDWHHYAYTFKDGSIYGHSYRADKCYHTVFHQPGVLALYVDDRVKEIINGKA